MTLVKNTAGYPLDLTVGRQLGVDQTADINTGLDHEARLLLAGLLTLVSEPSPVTPGPTQDVIVRAQLTDPIAGDVLTFTTGGKIANRPPSAGPDASPTTKGSAKLGAAGGAATFERAEAIAATIALLQPDGNIEYGTGAPASGVGQNGDSYVDTAATPPRLYGPKAAGAWPSGFVTLGSVGSGVIRRGSHAAAAGSLDFFAASSAFSDPSTNLGGTSLIECVLPRAAAGIRLLYTNHVKDDPSENPSPTSNPITIKAALHRETDSPFAVGFEPVFSSGRRSFVVEPDASVLTDPIYFGFPAAPLAGTGQQRFLVATYVSVTSGQKFPFAYPPYQRGAGRALAYRSNYASPTGSDLTLDGGAYSMATGSRMYGPAAVIAIDSSGNPLPGVFILGDSITEGYGNLTTQEQSTLSGVTTAGWQENWLNGRFGVIRRAQFGVRGDQVTDNRDLRNRLAGAQFCSTAIVALGRNDVSNNSTAAQVQATLTQLVGNLHDLGVPNVLLATITPGSSSSDSWATVANQTVGAVDPVRVAVNQWMRAGLSPADGIVDVSTAVESALDSGKWKPNLTFDGIHPTVAGYAAMSAAGNDGQIK